MVIDMTPSLLLAALFQSVGAVMVAAQRGRDRQVSPELASLAATTLTVVAVLPAVQTWGVMAAAHVMLVRAVAVWLLLLAAAGPSPPSWRGAWRGTDAWQRLWPLLAGSSIYKAAPLVDRFWSAMAPAGGVTLVGLAHSGMSAMALVLERSLCASVAPQLARLIAADDTQAARKLLRRSLLSTGMATLAVAMVFLLLKPFWSEALELMLKLQAGAAATLWAMCLLLLGYLYVAAAGPSVVAVFYALGDTRTPATIGVVGFVLGTALKSFGFLGWGLEGLVLATSAYHLCNIAALVFGAERALLLLDRTRRKLEPTKDATSR